MIKTLDIPGLPHTLTISDLCVCILDEHGRGRMSNIFDLRPLPRQMGYGCRSSISDLRHISKHTGMSPQVEYIRPAST